MADWRNSLIPLDSTLRDAVNTINNGGFEICLIIDADERLIGTITDGDVRRGLLGGLDMDAPAREIMNRTPITASSSLDRRRLLEMMNESTLRQIPQLDADRRIAGLAHIRDMTEPIRMRDNWVVLMAGGLGERLMPLTENTPKPLLTVAGKPVLQTILENFIEQHFHRFYISVNYKAQAIKEHFGDGSQWGVEILYLEEDQRLGTAGALQLLPRRPKSPLVIMNGDLMTRVNFQDLLDYHDQHSSAATMSVREYDFQVPFGVVDIDGIKIQGIDEKPLHRFFVNAGIYVIDPSLIDLIPQDGNFDMTDLFQCAIDRQCETVAFPIHEYWLDIGRIDDLERANLDFNGGLKS